MYLTIITPVYLGGDFNRFTRDGKTSVSQYDFSNEVWNSVNSRWEVWGIYCFLKIIYFTIFFTLVFCPQAYLCNGDRSSAIGVTDSYELSYGSWELNPGSLEKQRLLLTVYPSLQPEIHTAVKIKRTQRIWKLSDASLVIG